MIVSIKLHTTLWYYLRSKGQTRCGAMNIDTLWYRKSEQRPCSWDRMVLLYCHDLVQHQN